MGVMHNKEQMLIIKCWYHVIPTTYLSAETTYLSAETTYLSAETPPINSYITGV